MNKKHFEKGDGCIFICLHLLQKVSDLNSNISHTEIFTCICNTDCVYISMETNTVGTGTTQFILRP